MSNFFKLNLEIRLSDWPYLLQGFIVFFVLSFLGFLFLKTVAFQFFVLTLSLIFIIFTLFHFHNLRKQRERNFQYKIQVINELNRLLPIRAPLPPMNGWAATPELALNVYKVISTNKPDLIVELGSGVTSIISAYSLEKFNPGGITISFDHNADYANKTRIELENHQLSKYAQIVDAPLTTISLKEEDFRWYDIDFSSIQKPIDLLIIDGPPLKTQKNARYPALPLFYSYLSDNAVIIFHDTDRKSETKIIQKWNEKYPGLSCRYPKSEKGITVIKRKLNP